MRTILVVEDDANVLRLLSISLSHLYEVIETTNGLDALRMIKKHLPYAVLLDVMLPGEMDGLQVLDAVKSNSLTCGVLVVMVTACGQKADLDEATQRGADAYFIKPFSPNELITWLDLHVNDKEDSIEMSGP